MSEEENFDEEEEKRLQEEAEKEDQEYQEYLKEKQEDWLEDEKEQQKIEEYVEKYLSGESDTEEIEEEIQSDNIIIKRIKEALGELDTDKKYSLLKEIRKELDGLIQKKTFGEQLTNIGAQRKFAEIEHQYFNDWREEFVINGVIPKNGLTVLAGQSGGGKSWIAYEMMISILLKEKFLDKFEVENSNVLYFDLENDASTSRKRLLKLTSKIATKELKYLIDHGRLINVLYTENFGRENFEEKIKSIKENIEKNATERKNLVVFIDVFKRLFLFDENDASSTNAILTPLKQMCQKYNISIVLVHHTKKTNDYKERFDLFSSMRGSSEIYNIADSVLGVISEKTKTIEENFVKKIVKDLIFFQTKLRRAIDFDRLNVQMVETITENSNEINFLISDEKSLEEIKNKILIFLGKKPDIYFTLKQISESCEIVDISSSIIRNLLFELVKEKTIVFEGSTKSKKYKILTKNEEEIQKLDFFENEEINY